MKITVIYKTSLSNDDSNAEHYMHDGMECDIEPLSLDLYDPKEVGPMFKLTFADGWQTDSFEDELLFEGDGSDVD